MIQMRYVPWDIKDRGTVEVRRELFGVQRGARNHQSQIGPESADILHQPEEDIFTLSKQYEYVFEGGTIRRKMITEN